MSQKSSASAKFLRLYKSLPADAQRYLVEKQLVSILDLAPKRKARSVLSASRRLKSRYVGLPKLDLKAKQVELDGLLNELLRDAKRRSLKDRSNRDALLIEAVDSLAEWLTDIWSVVYEYRVDFSIAHACLLFTAEALNRITDIRGGCRCYLMNLPVSVRIRRALSHRLVHRFSFSGGQNLDNVLLWIWRDMFVSMLAHGAKRNVDKIPQMLQDIEEVWGWDALERLLNGGKRSDLSDECSDCCTDDIEVDSYDDSSEALDGSDHSWCPETHHGAHWSSSLVREHLRLHKMVQERLVATFTITPCLLLYQAILSNAREQDDDELRSELLAVLASVSTTCAETLSAAFAIYAAEDETEEIILLVNTQSHLLRPRDHESLRAAVSALSHDPLFRMRALQLLEKELLDTACTIRAAVLSCFHKMDERKEGINRILKLAAGSDVRADQVTQWVEAVVSPHIVPEDPIAFAAAMMGIPFPPGADDSGDADPLGYIGADVHDEDLDDLREEFRPKLKERWEGWCQSASNIKGGAAILAKVYGQVIEMMPAFKVTELIDEMMARLGDKPSKYHICDAMDALASFAKSQRKKMASKERKRKSNAKVQTTAPPMAHAQSADSAPSTSTGSISTLGAMDDVD